MNEKNDKDEKGNQGNFPDASTSRELTEQKAVTCANCGKVFNREKIFCPVCGLRYSEDANLPSEIPVIQQGFEQPGRSSRVFALLSLILGIAGPLALGIGWLLAIIFGFTSLNVMRTRGGFPRDRKLAVWGTTLGFLWPIVIGSALMFFFYHMKP